MSYKRKKSTKVDAAEAVLPNEAKRSRTCIIPKRYRDKEEAATKTKKKLVSERLFQLYVRFII